MKTKAYLKNGFGLFRNFGWKKNLLAIAAGYLLCLGLDRLSALLAGARMFSTLDFSIAIMPFIGFFLGIWGILGSFIEFFIGTATILITFRAYDFVLPTSYYIVAIISLIIYCALPSMLWYAFPLKGEERASFPRLDTSAHVIKYYLIMVITIAVYVASRALQYALDDILDTSFIDSVMEFMQYLGVVLIISIPIAIIISVIRTRTITINERMVLTFLIIGVIATTLCAILIYRLTVYLEPDLFDDYDAIFRTAGSDTFEQNNAEQVLERYINYWNWFYVIITVMLNILLIIETIFMRSIEKKVTKPIIHLGDVLEKYSTHDEGVFDPEQVKTECRPYRYGYGEVSTLTRTCVNMAEEIDSYTKNLEHVTAEKERISTELDVASNIQQDMLPNIFPPFPDRFEIDLYASMTPAKEVGGDFYDFFFVDDDHLVLVIADVSGKGVPASLFMVISKTLIQNHALLGGTPKEILSYVNHQLSQNNDSMMFCTVWLGILDLTNGKIVAANAGHEYPAILRNGEKFELMKGRHDPPLGVRDGLSFREYEFTLAPGDALFQYTDGVTEGTNTEMEEFGEERLVQALDENAAGTTKEIVDGVYKGIRSFVNEAPQFDDITMLCLKYMGPDSHVQKQKKQYSLTISSRVDRLDEVTHFTEEHLEEFGCPENVLFNMVLAVEEIFVNIASYAYGGRDEDTRIDISFNKEERMIEVVFTDRGIPFDPTRRAEPDITANAEDRQIGGLGIFIVKKTMDEVEYHYLGGKNILTIRKKI